MASRTQKPEVAECVGAVRLLYNVVNLGVLSRDEFAAELALPEISGDDGQPRSPPCCGAVSASCGVRALRGLQWRAVRLESFRHLLSTPA